MAFPYRLTANEYIERLQVDELPPALVEREFKEAYQARRAIAASGATSTNEATHEERDHAEGGASLSLSTLYSVTQERKWGGSLQLWPTGSLVQIRVDDSFQKAGDAFSPWEPRDSLTHSSELVDLLVKDDEGGSGRPGNKGRVTGFSKDSRRYLMRECAKIDRRFLPVMFTLTYADDSWMADPESWKRNDLRAFQMKLQRKYGEFAALWRLELKPRQTGERVGEVAPHFHLIVWLDPANMDKKDKIERPELLRMRDWVDEAWGRGRTRVESIRSSRGTTAYISKYIAKADTEEIVSAYPDGLGRVWGKWGAKGDVNLWEYITSRLESIQLTYLEAMALQRHAKRQIWGDPRDDIGMPTLHLFVGDPLKFLDEIGAIIEYELRQWAAEEKRKDKPRPIDDLMIQRTDEEMEAFRARLDDHLASGAGRRFVM